MVEHDDRVAVWVECVASSDNGDPFGHWLVYDEDWSDRDDLEGQIREVLKASPVPDAEKWRVSNANNLPKFLREDPDLDAIVQFAEGYDCHGEEFLVWAGELESVDMTEFEEIFYGWVENVGAFGKEFANAAGMFQEVSDRMAEYIDYEKFGNDLLAGDYYSLEHDHGLLIFRNC